MDLPARPTPGRRKLLLEGLVVLPVLLYPLYLLFEGSLIGDWTIFYRQASLRLLMGESPYQVLGHNAVYDIPLRVYNPVWLFALLSPIAVLPELVSNAVLRVLAFGVYFYSAQRLSADWRLRVAFLYSAPVALSLLEGQIDFLVLAALWLGAPLGLWLAAAKPQAGIALAAHQAALLWQTGRRRTLLLTAIAMALAIGLSVGVLGLRIEHALAATDFPWNRAIPHWWLRVPLTAGILALAYHESDSFQRKLWVAAASPMIASYAAIYSGVMLLNPLFKHPLAFALAWLLTWLLALGYLW